MNVAGSFVANAGGYSGIGNMREIFYIPLSGTYSEGFYGPNNCVAPCVIGGNIVQLGTPSGGTPPRINTSTSSYDVLLLPQNTVKYAPYWTQLDLSLGNVFNLADQRWEVKIEGFNLMNTGFERRHVSSRGTSFGRRSGSFENANELNPGRTMRLSFNIRF